MLAIDAGTTGVRTFAFSDAGDVLETAYRPLTQHFPRPGWVEQDPPEIWRLTRETLANVAGRLAERGVPVAALGITNQRETAIAWDRRDGRPLHRAIVWQDRRTAARCEELVEEGHLPTVRALTGLVIDPYFSATKYEWLLRTAGVAGHPHLALGTVDSWLVWQLTGGADGGVFATDATNAARTMLFDIERMRWSHELCELFGVPLAALPEVRPSCGRLGVVAVGDTGAGGHGHPLVRGVPVSALAGDQQAAMVGQACFREGLAKVTYGTGSFVLQNAGTQRPKPGDGVLTTIAWDLGDHAGGHPAVSYALEGSTFAAGAAIGWLRDGLGVIETAEELGRLAASVPDSGGVRCVPALSGLGSPWWDPRARGLVSGISLGTVRAQLARSVVEAMAFGVRAMLDAIGRAAGRPCSELRADGGASAMPLLLQLQADQLRIPVVRPRCIESTSLGAAMLAGIAEGVWGSLEDVARLWHPDVEMVPSADPAMADAGYASWVEAVGRSRAWARD